MEPHKGIAEQTAQQTNANDEVVKEETNGSEERLSKLPDDIETREFGQTFGVQMHRRLSSSHPMEAGDPHLMPQFRHDSSSLMEKEDKALFHDRMLEGDPAEGLPYNE